MTTREILFGLALLSVAVNTMAANPLLAGDINSESKSVTREGGRGSGLPLALEDNIFNSAYHDALTILSGSNRCSEFFGGRATVDIFNQMIAITRKDFFSEKIGIRMWGATVNILNAPTNRRYRLFEKVDLNGNGPFYRSKYSGSDRLLPGVGTYQPATKEVRVLMLLHELGHTVKTDEGKWLLPNDGEDEELSRRNSMKVEQVCGEEISKLGQSEGKAEAAPPAAEVSH